MEQQQAIIPDNMRQNNFWMELEVAVLAAAGVQVFVLCCSLSIKVHISFASMDLDPLRSRLEHRLPFVRPCPCLNCQVEYQ